jgi:hypothetical protein
MNSYSVTVRRSSIPALEVRLLVRADSKIAAGALAAAVAEQQQGGMFEPRTVRRARRNAEAVYDAA